MSALSLSKSRSESKLLLLERDLRFQTGYRCWKPWLCNMLRQGWGEKVFPGACFLRDGLMILRDQMWIRRLGSEYKTRGCLQDKGWKLSLEWKLWDWMLIPGFLAAARTQAWQSWCEANFSVIQLEWWSTQPCWINILDFHLARGVYMVSGLFLGKSKGKQKINRLAKEPYIMEVNLKTSAEWQRKVIGRGKRCHPRGTSLSSLRYGIRSAWNY